MNINIVFKKIIILIILLSGCSNLMTIITKPEINQGNYLNSHDIKKIKIGQSKQQIINLLGNPILTNTFNSNNLYYIYYKINKNNKIIKQSLILSFNENNILINVNHKQNNN
ncbi:outer membrane protein assembly factor BamE [Blochmannia endosymbiont of Colobopsis nipponica]|uniref:outer membrane protein assembly factor BamE n=1 Tax=Blochmannia endosymbiont of Colobopsis nipponica TaxID=2681987 RepID=UPI001780A61A|nr:outer membrane protein assembly factor BamE [Blochmannia endosymbiont of Colobopsis nipponica]